jgi:hypothetical protein
MKMVKIRFNTNYGKLPNQKKWRLLIDGTPLFVDEIELHCPCHTTEDIVVGDDGKDVLKFHITCEASAFHYFNKGLPSNELDFDKVVIQ